MTDMTEPADSAPATSEIERLLDELVESVRISESQQHGYLLGYPIQNEDAIRQQIIAALPRVDQVVVGREDAEWIAEILEKVQVNGSWAGRDRVGECGSLAVRLRQALAAGTGEGGTT